MVARTTYDCDVCGAVGVAQHEQDINAGAGSYEIDWCQGCRDTYMIDKLRTLLEGFGVARSDPDPDLARLRKPVTNDWPCCDCVSEFSSRVKVMTHLMHVHGMTKVEASHAAPPRSASATCVSCGFLADQGTGMANHIRTDHGPEAYATWTAGRRHV